jgi:hypothetical protein
MCAHTHTILKPKLHETGKRLEVSEIGTTGNVALQKWKRWGKRRIYIYIYKKNTLSCKKNTMTHINDIKKS